MLRRTLLRLYPDVLERITCLFVECHRRFSIEKETKCSSMSIERSIAQYEDAVEERRMRWDSLPNDELTRWERKVAESIVFEQSGDKQRQALMLECNPWLEWYHFPGDFHPVALRLLHGRLGIEEQYPLEDVAMVPCLYGEGAREVPVVDVQTKGIRLLQERPMAWGELEETLMEGFSLKSEESREKWRRITERQMAELIHKGVMAVRDNK